MSKMTKEKFIELYDTHIQEVYRFLFAKVGSQETAQDLASETFLRTWQYGKDNNIEHFRGFLFRTARNLTVDYFRKKARQNEVALNDELSAQLASADSQSDAANLAIINSDITQMQKHLSQLRSDYADVLILHYVQDMPIGEVAHVLEKSEGAVRVMLHRALEELKQFYE